MPEKFGPSLSFSPIAQQYDERYHIPTDQLLACYRRLIASGVLPAKGVVLDAGCGTGQMSLPLADLGYEVRGYDISPEMIEVARSKVRAELRATYASADVRSLPEESNAVDGIITCKLFVHISDWRHAVAELVRVLRPGACLVLLNDAIALENSIRSFFGRRADEAGYTNRFVGLHPARRDELTAFVETCGCTEVSVDSGDQAWSRDISFGTILDQFRQRLFAEFWLMPASDYEEILAETTAWVDTLPEGRQTVERITARLHVQVFRKSG